MQTHTQCNLAKGNLRDTCWIPSKFAVLGKIIRIKEEDGWEVIGVGNMKMASEEIEKRKNDYRTQRQASDI